MEFMHNGETMTLQVSEYNKGIAKVIIFDEKRFPYASLGKPSFPDLADGYRVLDDTLPEYESLLNSLIEQGFYSATNFKFKSGYKTYGIYKYLK